MKNIIILGFLVMSSCAQNSSEHWSIIKTDGLSGRGESLHDMLFVSDNIGFMVGYELYNSRC